MKFVAAFALACLTAATAAHAAPVYSYTYSSGGQNNSAGTPVINSTFDTNTDAFTWNVSFADGVARDTDGYWLVVGPGPNPKGHAFEYAMIYFDASTINNVRVSIYRYNGQNSDNSYTNPGDLLASSLIGGPTNIVASASQTGGTRNFNLSLDATYINGLFGPPGQPDWEGINYGANIGVWFHPLGGLTTAYNANSRLTSFSYARSGWVDLENGVTTLIPTPGSMGVLALGGLVASRRRRVA